ncbi:putative cytokinesis protein sepa [Diaporthe ampelina]|uniref:Putative cytokinesis protein sepa n=1 Tax=Diaporthe ampelina TaxID=1214573 RepID=A0A0G2IG80_9PEZI|nr:putative cytokinesis protein sepa [Diaporthe ampelina]
MASLFSRGKHKADKRATSDEGRNLAANQQLDTGSSTGSRSSRHNRESSVISVDRPNSAEGGGINEVAGVFSTIPYDSTANGRRSPVPVEYLPKPDHLPVRRDPLPHQLNKATADFHQYPSFDPNSLQSHARGLSPTSPGDAFYFPKPEDRLIDDMFLQLMQKRGWHNLPEQAQRQMLAYPSAKKWTLIYQDRLTEWQGEQKRRTTAKPGQYQTFDVAASAAEEGSPEWYVRKVMDNSLDTKGLGSLEVNLRTQQIGWVKRFIECQGQVALTNVLMKLNRKQAVGPAAPETKNDAKNLDREYDIVKCLKALMNNKFGADDALAHQQVIVALGTSLISPRLSTRKLVSEVLTFLCHWGDGDGHVKVIQAMDVVKNQQNENGRFDAWMRLVEVTVDGRGKMGSLVGASEEVRSGGIGMENLLMEYAVATLILINMIIDAPENDLQLRMHIRAQFGACGIKRILTKMEAFQYDLIDKQIERYRNNEAIDYEDMLERENSSIKDSIEGEVKDLNDPVQIADAIQSRLQGTKTQDYFISALQHLLLIREGDGEERLRMFQLVDSMLSYVAMDRRLPDMDLKQSLNFTVQSLLDKLHTDSEARQALDEALEGRQVAEAAMAERDEMKAQLELGADGLVAKLQKQLDEQARFIEAQRRQADTLKSELENIQNLRAKEAQRYELETRELYLMLRDAQDVAASNAAKGGSNAAEDPARMQGILDREKLMDRLAMQIERQKTQYKLEGRKWGEDAGPSDRLRALREEMEGYGPAGGQAGLGAPPNPNDFTHSVLGSVNRNTRMNRRRESQDGFGDEEGEDEDVVFEKPVLVELRRPRMDPKQASGLMGEIKGTVKRYDGSDSEGEQDATTGPSHPSLETQSPITPSDDTPKIQITGANGPPPPPPPPPPMPEEREEKYIELSKKGILDEVEKLFMAKEAKRLGGAAGKKDDKKQLISNDLRKAFEIALSKFSQHSVEKVVQMIIHCDSDVLDNPVVMDFLQKDDLCNIPENTAKVMAPYSKDWTGPDAMSVAREQDPAELTRQDQIYLQTAFELHYYWKSRMRALALTRSYEADYDEITEKMRQVVDVSESLRDSVALMNVLGLILDIGNYMNDANKQARGFKLSSLSRLAMVKDDKNQSTLADLVERIVRQQYPEWDSFVNDIQGVMTAQKINIEQLQADAKRYIDNVRNVQMSLDNGNLSDPKKFHPQDRVSQVVQRCMKEARRKAEQMQLYLEEMSRTYDEIMAFYGEDPTDDNARRDFFAKLALFISEWKRSRDKNVTFEEQRRRNEESMRRKNAALNIRPDRLADGGPVSPSSAGAMDSLLEKLRAAAPQTRDQRDRRRRARLKDRHQVRVASGQKIPEINEIPELDTGLLSAKSVDSHATDETTGTGSAGGSLLSPTSVTSPQEGEDDVAQRAAMLLQGMRDGDEGEGDEDRREMLRQARRKTAQDERNSRRRRREKTSSSQPPPKQANGTVGGEGEGEGNGAEGESAQGDRDDAGSTAHSDEPAAAAEEEGDVPTPKPEDEVPA